MENIYIDFLKQEEVSEILKIEEENFSEPWSEDLFKINSDKQPCYTLKKDDQILGYLCSIEFDDNMYISNVAVRKKSQGKGFGFYLINEILKKKINNGITKFYLEVRQSNIVAQNLYKKLGFRIFQKKEGYYQNPVEDALVLGRII